MAREPDARQKLILALERRVIGEDAKHDRARYIAALKEATYYVDAIALEPELVRQFLDELNPKGIATWPREGVYKLVDGSWMVPSGSRPNIYWQVVYGSSPASGSYFTCGCERGTNAGRMTVSEPTCPHVRRVAVAERADRIPPRPRPDVDTSMFH